MSNVIRVPDSAIFAAERNAPPEPSTDKKIQ
jgi:hypothetical protein